MFSLRLLKFQRSSEQGWLLETGGDNIPNPPYSYPIHQYENQSECVLSGILVSSRIINYSTLAQRFG